MGITSGGVWCWVGRRNVHSLFLMWWWVRGCGDDDDEELVGCVVLGFVIFFLAGAVFAAVKKKRLFGVFVWWWFPYDPDLCGGGDGGVKLWCRPHFWWCEEVPVGLQRLGSIRTFSFGLTTLLSGGLSIWIDGVAVVKVDFVVALVVVVVVAKVDSLRCHWLWLWRRWLLLFQSL